MQQLAGVDPPSTSRRSSAPFAERIHFVHLRNVKVEGDRIFHEVAHPSECGTVDILALMQALHDIDYSGPLRPDHGRRIWVK